jgi:hypothetical protein
VQHKENEKYICGKCILEHKILKDFKHGRITTASHRLECAGQIQKKYASEKIKRCCNDLTHTRAASVEQKQFLRHISI